MKSILKGVSIKYSETVTRAHCEAALILVETHVEDLLLLGLLGTG